MIQDRICRECAIYFMGGPRAYYCTGCRVVRQRSQGLAYQSRKRRGATRKLGSLDTCEMCKKEYPVNGGNQRFCSDCAVIHALEHDRETSLPVYYVRKDELNPLRNERRKQGMRKCDWCGKEHPVAVGAPTTCSPDCKRLLKNKKWNDQDKLKRISQSIVPTSPKE